ncbi:MAG: LysR family transcriptional regulator, partial [Acidovorax sp.]
MHGYPIALPERDNTVRQLFDIGCSQRGLVFEPALVCNHFETLMHFVLHGGGLSISGEVTVRDRVQRGELHAAQIREPGMGARYTELQTLHGRTLPAAVRMFLEFLRGQLRDNGAAPPVPSRKKTSPPKSR